MCRIAAFPPGFSRNEALDILSNFENRNIDGTGSAFIRDGEFVVEKWAKPFHKVIKSKPFLTHMPYNDGWTIVHLRAASHGCNKLENTHPFIVGPWAFIHNGIWSEHNLVRLALSKSVKFEGQTDSEVAGHFWNIVGPKKFAHSVDFGGVFMGLHRNGELWVAKTSGDLQIKALRGEKVLLASELDYTKYDGKVEALQGWYKFGRDGKYISHEENKDRWNHSYNYGSRSVASHGTYRREWMD
jgi:Glutamine amidotransferase domain